MHTRAASDFVLGPGLLLEAGGTLAPASMGEACEEPAGGLDASSISPQFGSCSSGFDFGADSVSEAEAAVHSQYCVSAHQLKCSRWSALLHVK